ncbi:MAG: hypothetical protein EAY75_09960 [Bacteroidetes bacterium]|nr:MAG: hypothetical protein EAY75_09960 [Bacteroidota bacterium]
MFFKSVKPLGKNTGRYSLPRYFGRLNNYLTLVQMAFYRAEGLRLTDYKRQAPVLHRVQLLFFILKRYCFKAQL